MDRNQADRHPRRTGDERSRPFGVGRTAHGAGGLLPALRVGRGVRPRTARYGAPPSRSGAAIGVAARERDRLADHHRVADAHLADRPRDLKRSTPANEGSLRGAFLLMSSTLA